MDKKLNEDSTSVKGKSGIKIKKANKGKFTDYCGGKVTDECILKGLNSSDPAVRKRANFARNARKWKHCGGGYLHTFKIRPNHVMDSNPKLDNMKRKYEEGGGFFNADTMQLLQNVVMKTANEITKYKKELKALDLYSTALRNLKRTMANEKGEQLYNSTLKKQFDAEAQKYGFNTSSDLADNFFSNRYGAAYYNPSETEQDIEEKRLKINDSFNKGLNSIGEMATNFAAKVGEYFGNKLKNYYNSPPSSNLLRSIAAGKGYYGLDQITNLLLSTSNDSIFKSSPSVLDKSSLFINPKEDLKVY